MSQTEKKDQQSENKEGEVENEGGVPCPPGYLPNALDFRSPAGRRLIASRTEALGKSLTFSPLVESVWTCISLFIWGGSIMMALNSMMTLVKRGFGAIKAAVAPNHRLNVMNRLIMVAIGGGLLLFVGWRAQAVGLFGEQHHALPKGRPVMFFEHH